MLFLNTHTHFSKHSSTEILQGHENEPTNKFHSLGIHPWDAERFSLSHEQLIQNVLDFPACLAIGEVGLDGLKGPDLEVQKAAFIAQINISEEYQLPVIIHCVKAWNELKTIKQSLNPTQKWIYHGFAQSAIVNEVIQQGMMISLGSAMLKHPKNQFIVDAIPDDRLLLETDDRDIEIIEIYETVARLKQISLQELTTLVTKNFKNTFQKWHIG